MEAANEKTDKKAVFSPYCGDETTTSYDRVFIFWLCHRKRLVLYFLKFQRNAP